MTKSLTNKLFVKKQLYSLQMEEGTDLLEHLNMFNQIVNKLANLEVKIEDEDKALLLLSSLPESYDHLVTTLLYRKETLEMDEVAAALISNDTRKKASSTKSQGEGFFGGDKEQERGRSNQKGSGKSRSKSKGAKTKVSCYYCKKEGHLKRECLKRKADLKKKGVDKASEEASVADSSDGDDGDVLSISSGKNQPSDSWILDSGCSYHMCPHKDWFDTYQPYNGGSVLMGNDAVCKTIGIGTIKIKMFDRIVRTLADVRHIPELRKNLISLGALDSNGCKYIAEGGVLKVIKGVMVVMKGQLAGNLYRLIGSTVIGGASVTTDAVFDTDDTYLWHMRLGHMGERGLMELHKRKMLKGVKTCKLNFCKYCVFGK